MLRASIAKGEKPTVDPEGGDYKQGMIRGFAMITKGEALGHGMWIDDAFLDQTVEAMRAEGSVKSRFTHPGLSGDGLGKFLGRAKNARRDGDKVLADLHFSESSHVSPDGDLAKYVMTLAKEDPEAFGASIVFEHDPQIAGEFAGDHLNTDGDFESPDHANEKNLPHARLRRLYAADIVDEPAANPDGLFHRGDEIADEADKLLSYALGFTDAKPTVAHLSIDPDRAVGFVKRFLDQHGVTVVPMEASVMGDDSTTTNDEAVLVEIETDTADEAREEGVLSERARFAELREKFPSDLDFVCEQFAAGASADDAMDVWDKRELERLRKENEELKARKPEPKAQGVEPIPFSGGENSDADFITLARAYKAQHKCTIGEANKAIARKYPEKFAAYKAGIGANVVN